MKTGRLWGLWGSGGVAIALIAGCGSDSGSSGNNGTSSGGTSNSSSSSGGGTSSGNTSNSSSSSGSGASSGSTSSSSSSGTGSGSTGSSSSSSGGSSTGGSSSGASSSGARDGGTTSGGNSDSGARDGAAAVDSGGTQVGSVIGTCDPTNLADKTCIPPEPVIPANCAKVAAHRTVTPASTAKGASNTIVPESATETLDTSVVTAGFANSSCVELTTGAGGANAFLIGQLKLTANQTLVIDQGVTVYASRNPKSYGPNCAVIDAEGAVTDTSYTADTAYDCGGVIVATGDHVAIMGQGTIDGQGGEPLVGVTLPSPMKELDTKSGDPACSSFPTAQFSWWNVSDCQRHDSRLPANSDNPDGGPGSAPNPALIQVSNASNFVLYKLHLYNSPFFHIQLNSDKFLVWGIDIRTPSMGAGGKSSAGQTLTNFIARNTDGIDPGAAQGLTDNGYIVYSTVSTGDDMVAIKGNALGGANNIVIAHNHFGTGHGMSLGSATIKGITNVHVYDMSIDGDTPVDTNTGSSDLNGLRIKSYTGAGGFVKNVLFESICTRDEVFPIGVTASYTANPIVDPAGVPPEFDNITVTNFQQINGTGLQHAHEIDVDLVGDATHQATIAFNNVFIEAAPSSGKGGPVLTVDATAKLTGTMSTGDATANNPCTGVVWWPTPPVVK
jgi:polygalacturonase